MRLVEPTDDAIREAADHLLAGRLVGMPTETVYGIAANALNPDAVRATFAAKGRPSENPLIVHLSSVGNLSEVAASIPDSALRLAEKFWPGPLTLVLPKSAAIPSVVTAGLDTVAVRVPAHPVAIALLGEIGVPLSAPSANLFMGLSPTRASAIDAEIGQHLALTLDGGPCEIGIESTVLDLTGNPRVLRPGGVSLLEIEEVIGRSIEYGSTPERRSPGMYERHYAPRTPVVLVGRLLPEQPGLAFRISGPNQVAMPIEAVGYARRLYAELRLLDEQGHEAIYVEQPPGEPAWLAVWDRLLRASTS